MFADALCSRLRSDAGDISLKVDQRCVSWFVGRVGSRLHACVVSRLLPRHVFADVPEVFTDRAKRPALDGVRREFGLADAGARDRTPRSTSPSVAAPQCEAPLRAPRTALSGADLALSRHSVSAKHLEHVPKYPRLPPRHACSMKDQRRRPRRTSSNRESDANAARWQREHLGDPERQTRALEIRHRRAEPRTTRALSEEWCTGMAGAELPVE